MCAPLKQITCPGLPGRLSSLRQEEHLKYEPSLFAVIRPNTTFTVNTRFKCLPPVCHCPETMTLVGDDGELRGHPSTVPGNLRNDDDATK